MHGRVIAFATEEPPVLRFTCDGTSRRDRPSAMNFAPDENYELLTGVDFRSITLQARLHGVESEDKVLLRAQEITKSEQRREYFRVRADFTVQVMPAEAHPNRHVAQVVCARDISGGGMRMWTRVPLRPGTKLRLNFDLAEFARQPIQCYAIVVRCKSPGEGYDVAVTFEDLDGEYHDAIMAFCFAKQREQLRNQVRVRDFE
ncbi:type IV pilus assembly PilZ [Desulfohalobium retbaense DSM 5692]|uniref:Type IV pilus assembly PilZ n=1 Tax=Desulfohalobium retbaense (strain ATCC 49708 / DSM 5692 / JCM 16813 / HR100) TaxID=485915 RepID=C8WZ14_DESRD|nr:type IV pilus assembly PilZ [Desulfohalobium retbaense DSM 5692]